MKMKLSVEGMSCMHCVMHVQDALKEVEGVTEAKADLDGKFAVIQLDREVPGELLKKAVEDAGYEVTHIEKVG
ncbi:MAG: heavy metal-associated domain-containing protein [Clostridiales bacterium]|jgi:copper ion binding protein|nr:heavy-metal-associated domain-containing protein [Eubacteriales bacterium]MDH7566376.1 heavy metal-associated domain-containing protein [Clostridiales bacterium]